MRKAVISSVKGLCLALVMLLGSCSSEIQPYYLNVVDIKTSGWLSSDKAVFEVPVSVPGKYKLFVTLRHTDDYQYSNIFIRVRVRMPDGTMETPRLAEIQLANKEGFWLGENNGVLFAKRAYITDQFDFSQTGTYTIDLTQYMRQDPLKHIEDVGIILIRE